MNRSPVLTTRVAAARPAAARRDAVSSCFAGGGAVKFVEACAGLGRGHRRNTLDPEVTMLEVLLLEEPLAGIGAGEIDRITVMVNGILLHGDSPAAARRTEQAQAADLGGH